MRILVGGGAGFIRSHFTEAACRAHPSARVTVLDNLTFAGVLSNLDGLRRRPRFRFVKGDIRDPKLARKLLKETDLLVNFAAETHVDRSLLWADTFLSTGVMGTFTLLEAAREVGNVKRLVMMSTDEVYGPVLRGLAPEGSPAQPEQSILGRQGGRRSARDLVRQKLPHAYHRSPRLQHLRPTAVPGKGDPALHHQRHQQHAPAGLRRRQAAA